MLPFKVSNKAVKVEGIPGIDGFVWLRPWSLGFFEKEIIRIMGKIAENREGEALPSMRFVIASTVCIDETGELAFTKKEPIDGTKGYMVPDPDHPAIADLPASIAGELFRAAVARCGPKESESEKNGSTPSPANG